MVTHMPIYIWIKGGRTSDCLPFKRETVTLHSRKHDWRSFPCSASSQWKQSWTPCHLLSISHGPLTSEKIDHPAWQSITATSAWAIRPIGPCRVSAFSRYLGWKSCSDWCSTPAHKAPNHHPPFCYLSHFQCMVISSRGICALCHLQFCFIL